MNTTILAEISRAGLTRHAGAIEGLLRSAIQVSTRRAASDDHIPVGASKIGGSPDLPERAEWPMGQGQPLTFIAQFDLKEVKPFDYNGELPSDGVLSFFFRGQQDIWGFRAEDAGAAIVLLSTTPRSQLIRTAPPRIAEQPKSMLRHLVSKIARSSNDEPISFTPCSVDFQAIVTLPKENGGIEFTDSEQEAYWTFANETLPEAQKVPQFSTQILGHSTPIQGEMELECQLVSHGINCGSPAGYSSTQAKSLECGANDWRLLLQVDSEENAGMMWGDIGMIYFWIRKQDLQAKSFDRVWGILQCH